MLWVLFWCICKGHACPQGALTHIPHVLRCARDLPGIRLPRLAIRRQDQRYVGPAGTYSDLHAQRLKRSTLGKEEDFMWKVAESLERNVPVENNCRQGICRKAQVSETCRTSYLAALFTFLCPFPHIFRCNCSVPDCGIPLFWSRWAFFRLLSVSAMLFLRVCSSGRDGLPDSQEGNAHLSCSDVG